MIGDGLRRRWADTQKGPVEKSLNLFIAGVIQVAIKQRDDELAREARKRQEEEAARLAALKMAEEKRRAEEQERIRAAKRAEERKLAEAQEKIRTAKWAEVLAERAKVKKLRQDASDWRESRQCRAYIAAVRRNAVARGIDVGNESEQGKWLQWATRQADRLDPFRESPHSILDDAEKYRPPE